MRREDPLGRPRAANHGSAGLLTRAPQLATTPTARTVATSATVIGYLVGAQAVVHTSLPVATRLPRAPTWAFVRWHRDHGRGEDQRGHRKRKRNSEPTHGFP
jgi:hypothetical protein